MNRLPFLYTGPSSGLSFRVPHAGRDPAPYEHLVFPHHTYLVPEVVVAMEEFGHLVEAGLMVAQAPGTPGIAPTFTPTPPPAPAPATAPTLEAPLVVTEVAPTHKKRS
jgi:hypothetical protein